MSSATPDVIFYNGQFTTLNPSQPTASAVAVQGGKFIAVGSDEDVLALAASATRTAKAHSDRTGTLACTANGTGNAHTAGTTAAANRLGDKTAGHDTLGFNRVACIGIDTTTGTASAAIATKAYRNRSCA